MERQSARLLEFVLALFLLLALFAGLVLVVWPKGSIHLLVGPKDWQTDGQFTSSGRATSLEVPEEVYNSPDLRLWMGRSSGALATLQSAPFDPPAYLGIPHYGFPGERPGNRIYLRCIATGAEIDVATVRTNNQWATEYLATPPKFCRDKIELVATVTTSAFIVGAGTPFAISWARYHALTGFPVRALLVVGTLVLLLGLITSIGYASTRLVPGTNGLVAGFVGLGSIAMVVFLVFHFSPALGRWVSVVLSAGGVVGLVLIRVLDGAEFRRLVSAHGTAVLYWFVIAFTYVAFVSTIDNGGGSWAINGMFTPLRWSTDNQIPFGFAEAL